MLGLAAWPSVRPWAEAAVVPLVWGRAGGDRDGRRWIGARAFSLSFSATDFFSFDDVQLTAVTAGAIR